MEITGKATTAKVFTDELEGLAESQIKTMCDQPFAKGSKVRIMPDVHAGAGCTVGTTMTITDKVVPNLVGVDIGCGMETVKLNTKDLDLVSMDSFIKNNIPSGFATRDEEHPFLKNVDLSKIRAGFNLKKARLSLGSLGGGNHFIEAAKDDEGNIYLVVHSGSRHMGHEIANYYQELAWKRLCGNSKADLDNIIAEYKAAGRNKEISSALDDARKREASTPRELAYLSGQDLDDYLNDMHIAQEYAEWNRRAIMDDILTKMNLIANDAFTTTHNYIDVKNGILRKGAVSAKKNNARGYIYAPVITEEEYTQSKKQKLLNLIFDGSVHKLLLNLVKHNQVTKEDLEELIKQIEKD